MRIIKAGKAVQKRIWEGKCGWCKAVIEDEEGSLGNINKQGSNDSPVPFTRVNCPNCNTELDLTLTKRVATGGNDKE